MNLDAIISGLKNIKTTGAGAAGGIAIVTMALQSTNNVVVVAGCIAGVAVFVGGLFSKDSTTGSQP
jgi:glycerate kinase